MLALWALNLEFEIGRLKFKVPPRKLCARLVLYYAGYVTCKKTTESPRTTAGERRHELARAARRPVLHVSEQQHRPPVSACLRVTWSLCTLPPLFKKRDTLEARAESHLDPPPRRDPMCHPLPSSKNGGATLALAWGHRGRGPSHGCERRCARASRRTACRWQRGRLKP